MISVLYALLWFALLAVVLGVMLAIASKVFAVKVDERIPAITECLPGANCGGCGYTGCAACAEAIVSGEAKVSSCRVGGQEAADKIASIMGVNADTVVRMRAQVMCSGTHDNAKQKYIYEGAHDCYAAMRLGGGPKSCPNGCIGLGSCTVVCTHDAIIVKDGIATVDYTKCAGCGMCVETCPKHIIKLVPYDSTVWVGCSSLDKGAITRTYCEVGCIGCKLCEKACEHKAIHVDGFVASIDYEKCTGCGACVAKCPRGIIHRASDRFVISDTITK